MDTNLLNRRKAVFVKVRHWVNVTISSLLIMLICVVGLATVCLATIVVGIPICILFVVLLPMMPREERRRQTIALAMAITDM